MTKSCEPLYDLETSLKFLKETKDGKFAQIEENSLDYIRSHIDAEYIKVDETEYYHSFDS